MIVSTVSEVRISGDGNMTSPCSDRAIYCKTIGSLHVHDLPQDALVESCADLVASNRHIAGCCRSSRTSSGLGRYRDPVLHEFAEWAADCLDRLGKLLKPVSDAACHQDAVALGRTEHDLRAAADDFRREFEKRAVSLMQLRTGRRKRKVIDDLHVEVRDLFKAYAEATEIMYLAQWVCSGVRPADANNDAIAAERGEQEGGCGN